MTESKKLSSKHAEVSSTDYLDSIEKDIIFSLKKGGEGEGLRIRNDGKFKVHHVVASKEDVDLINCALDGI